MSIESPRGRGGLTVLNEPKLSSHESDKQMNERRLALAAALPAFIADQEQHRGRQVALRYAQTGISSLVAIIETEGDKSVLKVPLLPDYAQGEAAFLRAWADAEVKTPRVLGEGVIAEHPYIWMEHIDAPTLSAAYSPDELRERGVYHEMGQTLRRMHGPVVAGYGRVVDGAAEFATFDEWLASPDIEVRIARVREKSLLTDEHGSIDVARDLLMAHVAANPGSSYCHDDYGAENIFATSPLTVFDPNPRFHNGYLDLARAALKQVASGVSPTELIEGYFDGEAYDQNVLRAAILLNAHMKFRFWDRVNKTDHMQRVRDYLLEA